MNLCISQVEIFEVVEAMVENRSTAKHFPMKLLSLNTINAVFWVSGPNVSLHRPASDDFCFCEGMANKGYRHSNGSQFYVTLSDACDWMSNRFVAFGRVVEGFDTLSKLEQVDTINQRPIKSLKISDCGVIQLDDE